MMPQLQLPHVLLVKLYTLLSVLLVNLVQMVVKHALQVLFAHFVKPPIILTVLPVPCVMKDVMDVQKPLVVLPVRLVTDQ